MIQTETVRAECSCGWWREWEGDWSETATPERAQRLHDNVRAGQGRPCDRTVQFGVDR